MCRAHIKVAEQLSRFRMNNRPGIVFTCKSNDGIKISNLPMPGRTSLRNRVS
ncbi:hypothetical protein OCK74_27645 [Chitinophagaceae bacterium LB-8]|uniref:Uncharacterized protein n=1 Tax=Paraflavisolibacter caeni TaxID=2982496 RepID=A0A9X3BHV2_9BACT|nr:hypothetical protein [Paraflavisolibacter caeni]MCU7552924.1 hypothetical protein [Paraflavisolibacter caeni]